jgi:hypothetical protein
VTRESSRARAATVGGRPGDRLGEVAGGGVPRPAGEEAVDRELREDHEIGALAGRPAHGVERPLQAPRPVVPRPELGEGDLHGLLPSRDPRRYAGSTRTSVRTELAMKHSSWARWCMRSSTSAGGGSRKVTTGRSTTRVIASLPSAFGSRVPTAASR